MHIIQFFLVPKLFYLLLFTCATSFDRYAIVKELASLGATVHTCSRNETQLNECLHEWKMKVFRVIGSINDVGLVWFGHDLVFIIQYS